MACSLVVLTLHSSLLCVYEEGEAMFYLQELIANADLALVVKLLCIGAGAGMVSGVTGLGGGVVIVPFLSLFLGMATQSAIVISMAAVAINAVSASLTKKKQYQQLLGPAAGLERFHALTDRAKVFKYGIGLASLVTGLAFGSHNEAISIHVIDLLFFSLVAVMMFNQEIRAFVMARFSHIDFTQQHKVQDFFFGGLIGLLSAAIGIGGGTYTINYFAIRHNVDIKDGTTISNYTGFLVGVTGLIGFLLPQFLKGAVTDLGIPYPYIAVLLVAGYLGAKLGVHLQKCLDADLVKKVIYVIVLGSIAKNELPLKEVFQAMPASGIYALSAACTLAVVVFIAVRLKRASKR